MVWKFEDLLLVLLCERIFIYALQTISRQISTVYFLIGTFLHKVIVVKLT
jgi:hypothetical protein